MVLNGTQTSCLSSSTGYLPPPRLVVSEVKHFRVHYRHLVFKSLFLESFITPVTIMMIIRIMETVVHIMAHENTYVETLHRCVFRNCVRFTVMNV